MFHLLEKLITRLEKTIGGLKFAVIVILIFSIAMITGTFLESYYGTEFASRVIYKKWPFMLLQLGMFLSIFFATMLRLPPVKRLYGFYTIHAGLILIGMGSFATYISGIDGSILLSPQTPTREVVLNEDVLLITIPEEGKSAQYELPYTAFEARLDASYDALAIKLKKYLPSAEQVFAWTSAKKTYERPEGIHSSRYTISNPNVTQDFTLSLHPEANDFESNVTLGPLTIHYLPAPLADCFNRGGASQLVLWDNENSQCYTPEEKNIEVKTTKPGNRFFVVPWKGSYLSFFPDHSPWPMDEKLNVLRDSPVRVFSKNLFTDKPNLFLFGKNAAYYDKSEERWFVQSIPEKEPLDLPWMGFELFLNEHENTRVPTLIPTWVTPIQQSGKIVRGEMKALLLSIKGEDVWLTNFRPLSLLIDGKRVDFQLTKNALTLPFELVLTQFKMEKDPGTNRPASYESFIRLFDGGEPEKHHIFMNNPLKRSGFTFYQASYSQDRNGVYSSTLSVNMDPGRPIKYFGSLLLVLGAIWHYNINVRRKKKETPVATHSTTPAEVNS